MIWEGVCHNGDLSFLGSEGISTLFGPTKTLIQYDPIRLQTPADTQCMVSFGS